MLSEGGDSPGLVSKILAVYFMKQRKEFFELSELTTVFQQPKPTEHIRYCAELWKGTAQETRQRGQTKGAVACQGSHPVPEIWIWEQVIPDMAGWCWDRTTPFVISVAVSVFRGSG